MNTKEFEKKSFGISKKITAIKDEITELICKVCKERNIGGMFFQNIPTDKTYAVVDSGREGYGYLRVEGFCISESGKSIYLMTEDDYFNMEESEDELVQETLDYVFLTPEHAEKFDEYFATSVDDTFCPTDTLSELLYTLNEMLKVMDENGFAMVSQSIQLKELDETTI